MCVTCGCSGVGAEHEHVHPDGTRHRHSHGPAEHHHGHTHDTETVRLEADILAKNDLLAARNRGWLEGREVLALNLVSGPGAGKTTLLERTIRDLEGRLPIAVIEGDQATDRDAARIRATGCEACRSTQVPAAISRRTWSARGLRTLQPRPGSVLMIENVGNLVCPALFDLGEHAKVVLLSVTEGDDKPEKYPHMFRAASVLLITKIDLLPHVPFDLDRCIAEAKALNPGLQVLTLSAVSGEGLDGWYAWLTDSARSAAAPSWTNAG